MQETTLFMWEHFDQFKESSNFTAWGISIARNMVLQHCRKQRGNKLIFSLETVENLISQSDVFDSSDDVAEALRHCLKKLNSRQRELLEMRYYQGNSIRTIAERVNQATSHLYRVMANIHKSLLRCINIQLLS
jgi:RNA polymerase sigma-70 factor (ECF subfamily)